MRGYSPELCTLHRKYLNSDRYARRLKQRAGGNTGNKIGKTLALGACAGLAASSVGLTAAFFIGLKSLCEAAIATTVVAGAGITGAVTNAAVTLHGEESETQQAKPKKKVFLPPLYLNGGSNDRGI